MPSDAGNQKARDTQIAKYGGLEGYRAEMRRRAHMVKHRGNQTTTKFYGKGLSQEMARRVKIRWDKHKNAKDKDRQSGQVL